MTFGREIGMSKGLYIHRIIQQREKRTNVDSSNGGLKIPDIERSVSMP
jgi:non-ribosomal peptide synthetase component F